MFYLSIDNWKLLMYNYNVNLWALAQYNGGKENV